MLKAETKVIVEEVSRRELYEFMLYCTDEDYREWWPGTHLAFHTIRRTSNNKHNQVYFDEFVGRVRLRFHAVVTDLEEATRIVWQLKKVVRLPVRLSFEVEDHQGGVLVRHTLMAGFGGRGQVLDPIFRTFLSQDFIRSLDEHARTEFPMLAELLAQRRVDRT